MIRVRTLALALAFGFAALFATDSVAAPRGVPGQITPQPRLFNQLSCKQLNTFKFRGGKIEKAEVVPAGTFMTPTTPSIALPGLPKFCRVVGTAFPTADSRIGFEVWIPYDGSYRDRYLQVGNGGFSGDIVYIALAEGIRRGYATASTDDGSQTHGTAEFVLGHPEKVIDYGYRALKETTDKAKAIIRRVMDAPPERSYFHGCSNGGREALMEAQRYPDDFDGIIVGAPANYFTHQFAAFVWNTQRIYPPASVIPRIPNSQLHVLSNAVRAQCAGHDGGLATDKFLTNPPACHVDFAPMTCAPGSPHGSCFTPDQIDIIQAIYEGPVRDDASHAQVYPGFEPGAESHACNWGMWMTGKPVGSATCGPEGLPHVGLQALFGIGFFAYFVQGHPSYDIHTLNFASDIDDADTRFAATLNSTDPDLRRFRAHRGKIIHYHGWDDAAVAARNSIDYWGQVEARMKTFDPGFSRADMNNFYRLFMAPGMSHCAGGPGATAFGNLFRGSAMDADHDVMLAMERWVEDGVAPERIVAQHLSEGVRDPYFERPLCVYPKLPKYNGAGDSKVAANWSCVAPLRFSRIRYPPEPIRRLPRPR